MHIEFIPSSKYTEIAVPMPKPAKMYVPDWYKNIKPDKKITVMQNGITDNAEIKRCMPFLDSLTSGYIQETWTDIAISRDGMDTNYTYAMNPSILKHRPKVSLKTCSAYNQIEMTWQVHWAPKLPKGWSVLITHPANRLDLPFVTLTGIVDADSFSSVDPNGANLPFFLYENFEGIIPAGTPMYQIIPFKREDWTSSAGIYNEDESMKKNSELRKYFFHGYKKLFWNKKNYN